MRIHDSSSISCEKAVHRAEPDLSVAPLCGLEIHKKKRYSAHIKLPARASTLSESMPSELSPVGVPPERTGNMLSQTTNFLEDMNKYKYPCLESRTS